MKRPTITSEVILQAATIVAKEIDQACYETIAKSIDEEYIYPMDGFDLAKRLDKWQNWDTTREQMETLDNMDHEVDKIIKVLEKQWFESNNIQPPFSIGTKITKGVITGIYEYGYAKYEVKENGCTQDGRSLIIKFEDAVLADGES